MRDVIVYTTEPCSFCTRVKMFLRSRGVDFREINLAGDGDGLAALAEQTGYTKLPQVTIDGILVGGYEETLAASQSGLLDDLLAA